MDHAASTPLADVAIGPDEHVGRALVRIGCGLFSRITAVLADPTDRDAGVHEARKALKRLRALLRLARIHLGKESFRRNDMALRDLGRMLASLREMRAAMDTIETVVPGRYPGLLDLLAGRHESTMESAGPESTLLTRFAVDLGAAEGRWQADLSGAVPDGFDALAGGLDRTYRRGRKRMKQAGENPRDEVFHQWRKEVKYLRYQLESIRPSGPDGPDRLIRLLDELGEILGLEHDLTVMLGLIGQEGVPTPDAAGLPPVLLARKVALRADALRLGAKAYARSRGSFLESVRSEWDAARSGWGDLGGPRG